MHQALIEAVDRVTGTPMFRTVENVEDEAAAAAFVQKMNAMSPVYFYQLLEVTE